MYLQYIGKQDADGNTALMTYVSKSQKLSVAILNQLSREIGYMNNKGISALMIMLDKAVDQDYVNQNMVCLSMIIEKEKNLRYPDGTTFLMKSIKNNNK